MKPPIQPQVTPISYPVETSDIRHQMIKNERIAWAHFLPMCAIAFAVIIMLFLGQDLAAVILQALFGILLISATIRVCQYLWLKSKLDLYHLSKGGPRE